MIYIAIFILNIFDLLTTHYAVNIYQIAIEGNPIMAPIISSWQIVPLKLGGAFFMAFLLYRLRKKYPKWRLAKAVTIGALAFYFVVVLNNSLILFLSLGLGY